MKKIYILTVAAMMGVGSLQAQSDVVSLGFGNKTAYLDDNIDDDTSTSEVVYSTNETFANTANGTFPVGQPPVLQLRLSTLSAVSVLTSYNVVSTS